MLKLIAGAAIAATLFVVPGAVLSQQAAGVPQARAAVSALPNDAASPAPATPLRDAARAGAPATNDAAEHEQVHESGLAPGQSRADYEAWLARSPANRDKVAAFTRRLEAEGVAGVVPTYQLIRTSSSWRQCAAEPFEVAPAADWDHMIRTLRFVRDNVVPAIGPVEALSGYRNHALNACSNGAPASAHRHFFALDLTPVRAEVDRSAMIRDICAAHARDGRDHATGLGFYSGRRFHVDSKGYRKWGPNGRGATSPCVTMA